MRSRFINKMAETGSTFVHRRLVLAMNEFYVFFWSSAKVWPKEFCQFESFNASCNAGHVILMTEARYGRLHLGRCVSRDYGHVGCSADVIEILDRTCSGQRRCQLPVPTLREVVQPCPKDLTSYLEASYTCIAGKARSQNRCHRNLSVKPLYQRLNKGYKLINRLFHQSI